MTHWMRLNSKNHSWMKNNGNLVPNKRTYNDVLTDLIKFFQENGGKMAELKQ